MMNDQERWQREQELLDMLTNGQVPLDVYEQMLQELRTGEGKPTFPPLEKVSWTGPTFSTAAGCEVWMTRFGSNKMGVIKVVRALTGYGLVEAKALVESAPCQIRTADDPQEAQLIVNELERAGATCEIRQSGSNVGANLGNESSGEQFVVVLEHCGPNKISAIKIIRDWTGCGLKEAKDLSEQTPSTIFETASKTDAEQLLRQLQDLGASAQLMTAESSKSFAATEGGDLILTSFGSNKLMFVKLVRDWTGCGLKEAVDFVQSLPRVVASCLSAEELNEIRQQILQHGGTCEIR